jgi:hypothetical protein
MEVVAEEKLIWLKLGTPEVGTLHDLKRQIDTGIQPLESALAIPAERLFCDRHVPELRGHPVEVFLLGERWWSSLNRSGAIVQVKLVRHRVTGSRNIRHGPP